MEAHGGWPDFNGFHKTNWLEIAKEVRELLRSSDISACVTFSVFVSLTALCEIASGAFLGMLIVEN